MSVVRLRCVRGHEGRANDVLFAPAVTPSHRPHTLIYFGGDVQDYPEVMESHRENKNYLKWSLENMARLLGKDFPTNHILIVRPSRIEYKSFSCYDNFVPSNTAGIPDHTPTHGALHHLQSLLKSVTVKLKALPASDLLEAANSSVPEEIDIEELHAASLHKCKEQTCKNDENASTSTSTSDVAVPVPQPTDSQPAMWWRPRLRLDASALSLAAFSKGCVVLNQLIYEFHYTQTLTPGDQHMLRFISQIESMWWLDGGHAGGKNTWITARSLLETLTRLDMNLYIHVSPYQVKDETRPWIGREEKAFISLLRLLGAKMKRYMHDKNGIRSMLMHFQVLSNFMRVQQTCAPSEDSDEESD